MTIGGRPNLRDPPEAVAFFVFCLVTRRVLTIISYYVSAARAAGGRTTAVATGGTIFGGFWAVCVGRPWHTTFVQVKYFLVLLGQLDLRGLLSSKHRTLNGSNFQMATPTSKNINWDLVFSLYNYDHFARRVAGAYF